MSKLYTMMNCPICGCSTVDRESEVYECMACREKWEMVTATRKIITVATSQEPCGECEGWEKLTDYDFCPRCSLALNR